MVDMRSEMFSDLFFVYMNIVYNALKILLLWLFVYLIKHLNPLKYLINNGFESERLK